MNELILRNGVGDSLPTQHNSKANSFTYLGKFDCLLVVDKLSITI